MTKTFSCFLALIFALWSPNDANAAAPESTAISELTTATTALIESLSDEQREQALFAFASEERENWHFVPRTRQGLAWAQMTESQFTQSWTILESVLSQSGLTKTKGVITAEEILYQESGQDDFRNPKKYYLSIFGTPSTESTWGLRFEGHHLSLNLTVIDGQHMFVTPSFFGANPDDDRAGHRPLAGELDQALALVGMLDDGQRTQAVNTKKTIKNIFSKPNRDQPPATFEGLAAAEMTPEQQAQLKLLINEYVGRYRAEYAADDLAKIEAAGFDSIHFWWAGATERGKATYYRVHGPTFILEYANAQNGGNHAHTVWRDFEHDFGHDALGDHFQHDHSDQSN